MSQYSLAATIASQREFLLPDTSNHTIVSATVPSSLATTNYDIEIYYRVITATTTVTISASWTDASGSQTMAIVSAASIGTGSYTILPIAINATAASLVSVSATAGTANQVYITANILMRSF